MKKTFVLAVLLMVAGLAFGQVVVNDVKVCNSFAADGVTPIFSAAGFPNTTGTTACTDIFGVPNYANSPLPVRSCSVATTTTCFGDADCGLTGGVCTGVITSGGMHKFVDTLASPLAGLTLGSPTNIAATATVPASDYYEIALVQNTVQMHSELPATTVRGYVQVGPGSVGCPATPPPIHYLGPVILAQKNKPVRIKFINCLPSALAAGNPGNLIIPTDNTYMGAGDSPDPTKPYLENRATLHLHGGATPWISDGTPHQWTVPAADWRASTPSPTGPGDNVNRGLSTQFVPDMWFNSSGQFLQTCTGQTGTCQQFPTATNDPGHGAMTFYYTNQQGGRLMFYHDHAYGITRLNVYAGEAAGYLLADPVAEDALFALGVPGTIGSTAATTDLGHIIPLVIQDKTFVPPANQLAVEDPTWTSVHGGGAAAGNLWYPHVYMPNQNPADLGGANAFGRWDYGPWFFPPQTTLTAAANVTIPCTSASFPGVLLQPTAANNNLEGCPIVRNPSGTPESFMDTPLVNGKAYPVLHVAPESYRFQMLSAGNDRSLNLSFFVAASNTGPTTAGAIGTPVMCTSLAVPGCTEVAMVPFNSSQNVLTPFPASWYSIVQGAYAFDDRIGGVPNPTTMGPPFIQIGSEGGLLPGPAVIQPQPVNYEMDKRNIVVTNVKEKALFLGPAERADAIVDFTGKNGYTFILYNDAPAPVPASDPRQDYFTGGPDMTSVGGAPSVQPGYGPNTRTLMKIVVDLAATGHPAPSVATLLNGDPTKPAPANTGLPGIFKAVQPVPIVPEPTYPVNSGGNGLQVYGGISDNTITFTPNAPLITTPCSTPSAGCVFLEQKAIQELFTLDYGRMNATLGVELPLTNFLTQTTIPYGYIDWPTELLQDGATQIWKITHNGVDTHLIHFHLFNVQVINRVGWDGAKRPPDANELGWKDTVRMHPLEDIFVALSPIRQDLPWPVPDSIRPEDTTVAVGTLEAGGVGAPDLSGIDPVSGNALPTPAGVTNAMVNFGWEYVWHCHILGHEENDMMRPMIFQVAPPAPNPLVASANAFGGADVIWVDNSASETSFTLQRDVTNGFLNPTNITVAASSPATAFGGIIFTSDTPPAGTFYYRAQAVDNFSPTSPLPVPFQPLAMASAWSNTFGPVVIVPRLVPNPTSLTFGPQLVGTTSARQNVTLTNTSAGSLPINSVTWSGNFVDNNNCPKALAAGKSCTIGVRFQPTVAGALNGTLTIASTTNVTVALSGTGIAPIATLSTAGPLTFNSPLNTTSAVQTITVKNTGTAPLTISSVTRTGTNANQFANNGAGATPCRPYPRTLQPNATCTIDVTFTPTSAAPATKTANLNVNVAAPAVTQTIALTGNVVATVATFTQTWTGAPGALIFGTTPVAGGSVTRQVIVTNTGNVALRVTGIALGGTNANQYTRTTNCVATFNPGAAPCTITVTFNPSSTGTKNATLTVNVAAPAVTKAAIALTGTGN